MRRKSKKVVKRNKIKKRKKKFISNKRGGQIAYKTSVFKANEEKIKN